MCFGCKADTKGYILNAALPVISTLLAVVVLLSGAGMLKGKIESEQQSAVETEIRHAASQCYNLEGFYPEDIDYLKKNYGLKLNDAKFSVDYKFLGRSTSPVISVNPALEVKELKNEQKTSG